MENRIKECQGDLFADRTSTATMRANQLRLWFASMAYALLCALRRIGLAHTQLANATCGTIRLKLLKLGALVKISAPSLPHAQPPRNGGWRPHGSPTRGLRQPDPALAAARRCAAKPSAHRRKSSNPNSKIKARPAQREPTPTSMRHPNSAATSASNHDGVRNAG
jgi:Transposase DDE domain group 1